MKRLLLSVAIAALAASCGADADSPSTGEKTETVKIHFYQALVSPVKRDGCMWGEYPRAVPDENGCFKAALQYSQVLDSLTARAASGGSVPHLVDEVQGDTFAWMEKPEVVGRVRLQGQSQPGAPLARYSFIAMLGDAEFADVPLDTVFHVDLSGRDPSSSQELEIGNAIIAKSELERALRIQAPVWVSTSTDFRTNGVLAVMIAVVPTGSEIDPDSALPVEDEPAPF
jgi:hypothetical protein